jgi:hypothetical protein
MAPAINLNGTLTYVLTHTDIQQKALVMAGVMAAATQLTAQAARGLAMAVQGGSNGVDPASKMAAEEAQEVETPFRTKIGQFLEGDDVAEAAENARKVGRVTGVVDRAGAAARRAERMKGRPTVPGMDRDEFPPAAIRPDDPSRISVSPVNPSHNRRSGGRLRAELPPDGTLVEIDP